MTNKDFAVIGVACTLYSVNNKKEESLVVNINNGNNLLVWDTIENNCNSNAGNQNADSAIYIDQYDVRMLLSSQKDIPRRFYNFDEVDYEKYEEKEEDFVNIMYERYRDLFSDDGDNDSNDRTEQDGIRRPSSQRTISYNYANEGYKSNRQELWERPKPEDYFISNWLLDEMENVERPQSKKQFDIILHTCKNIRQHGNQLEVLLKVKHADEGGYFDFLNYDSNLYAFFQVVKGLPEKSFWDVFLGKDRPSDDSSELNIEQTIESTKKGTALELLSSMYNDSEESDSELNATDNASVLLIDDPDCTLQAENDHDKEDSIGITEVVGGPSTDIVICHKSADPQTADGHNNTVTNDFPQQTGSDGTNSKSYSIIDAPNEGTLKSPPVSSERARKLQDAVRLDMDDSDDDLLDEDVDEERYWGFPHVVKKAKLHTKLEEAIAKRKADRLRKVRNLKAALLKATKEVSTVNITSGQNSIQNSLADNEYKSKRSYTQNQHRKRSRSGDSRKGMHCLETGRYRNRSHSLGSPDSSTDRANHLSNKRKISKSNHNMKLLVASKASLKEKITSLLSKQGLPVK